MLFEVKIISKKNQKEITRKKNKNTYFIHCLEINLLGSLIIKRMNSTKILL